MGKDDHGLFIATIKKTASPTPGSPPFQGLNALGRKAVLPFLPFFFSYEKKEGKKEKKERKEEGLAVWWWWWSGWGVLKRPPSPNPTFGCFFSLSEGNKEERGGKGEGKEEKKGQEIFRTPLPPGRARRGGGEGSLGTIFQRGKKEL